MKPPVETYINATLERIEEELDLGRDGRKRLEEEMRSEIQLRLPDTPTLEQIETEFGSSASWASEFVENSDSPKASFSPEHVNRRSKTEIFGIPLVHVAFGARNGKRQVARGIIAIGDFAIGLFAFGNITVGGLAMGGCSAGLISFGGCALGLLLALGGCAVGGIAFGGMSVGIFAWGGCAIGFYALGGFACGHTVVGGFAYGINGLGGLAMVRNKLDETHWLWQLQMSLMSNQWMPLACFLLIPIVPTIAMLLGYCWAKKKSVGRFR